jgi:hypothetical protein
VCATSFAMIRKRFDVTTCRIVNDVNDVNGGNDRKRR